MSDETEVDSPAFVIESIRPSDKQGEVLIDYTITDEFKTWFKQKHGLKRWSRKKFETQLAEMVKYKFAIDLGLIEEEKNND